MKEFFNKARDFMDDCLFQLDTMEPKRRALILVAVGVVLLFTVFGLFGEAPDVEALVNQ